MDSKGTVVGCSAFHANYAIGTNLNCITIGTKLKTIGTKLKTMKSVSDIKYSANTLWLAMLALRCPSKRHTVNVSVQISRIKNKENALFIEMFGRKSSPFWQSSISDSIRKGSAVHLSELKCLINLFLLCFEQRGTGSKIFDFLIVVRLQKSKRRSQTPNGRKRNDHLQ
jgi:hypothetical protein